MFRTRYVPLALCLALVCTIFSRADEPGDSLQRDYREELPRIAATEPAAALASFQLKDGFQLQQVAAEPLVTDPVAIAFDEHGRMFVVEMRGYSEDPEDDLGRIRLLEDTDRDGIYDASRIYIDGLSWPTGLACFDGGLFVAVAPDLRYYKDTDGDGRAELVKTVATGFGRTNVQGLLNSLTWGLDHRIHGATSSSGAQLQTGPQPLVLRGRDFALDPRSGQLAPVSGGGQHGLSFNAWGEKFVCSNSDHIQLVMFEDRYAARNPYVAAPPSRQSIAADGPQADVFRTSPVEPWRIVRTRLRRQGIVPGPVERGGKAAGYFTGATGIMIYTGDNWPSQYAGWALICDVGSNLVHRKRLEPEGVGYRAVRTDEQSELLTSRDIWFRPVQLANGPDGALYVIDMYREVIEHPDSLPPIIKQHLDLTSGRNRGRIYRVLADGKPPRQGPWPGEASNAELVAMLDHPNGWHRQTAARLLYERQDPRIVPALRTLAREGRRAEGRLQALYSLAVMGQIAAADLRAALRDEHPRVRQHAVRLSEQETADAEQLRGDLLGMTDDPDLKVRYQLAFTLGELQDPRRIQALVTLARRDVEHAYVLFAIQSSLVQDVGAVLAQLAEDVPFRQSSRGRQFLASLARQIVRQQRAEDVAALLQVMSTLSEQAPGVARQLLAELNITPDDPLSQKLAAATSGRSQELFAQLLQDAIRTLQTSDAPLQQRIEAAMLLPLGSFAEVQSLYTELLTPSQPMSLQLALLASLQRFTAPQVAELLIDSWPQFSPRLRTQAADLLMLRPDWQAELVTALEAGTVGLADIGAARLQAMTTGTPSGLQKRIEKLLASSSTGKRHEVLARYRAALQMPGDPEKGQAIFRRVCAACHRVGNEGHNIGPNLLAMQNRGPEAILSNVLAPNQEVNPQYLTYVVLTTDGRSLSGMIGDETATSLTLLRGDQAQDTILRVDIEEIRSTGQSLMPEGLEQQIDISAMADLLAYLQSLP